MTTSVYLSEFQYDPPDWHTPNSQLSPELPQICMVKLGSVWLGSVWLGNVRLAGQGLGYFVLVWRLSIPSIIQGNVWVGVFP